MATAPLDERRRHHGAALTRPRLDGLCAPLALRSPLRRSVLSAAMAYLPHSDDDRRAMLEAVGVSTQRDLFASVPSQLLEPPVELPPPLSEQERRASRR